MFIQEFPSGPFETNAYVVGCTTTKQAVIIDPAPESADAILDCLETKGFHCIAILLTHSHWDHIADAPTLKDKLNVPIYIHELDAPNLKRPGADGLPLWVEIRGLEADHLIHEGMIIPVGELSFHVLETPGHTPGGVCFYEPEEGVLFSGDTLFKGTIGNLSFPTARPHLMWHSLDKLAELPAHTHVYPGHGPSTRIGKESWLPNARDVFGS